MQTINRIIDLLELLSQHNNGLMISEISQEINLPISTTHRMLNSLKKRGYISQDALTKRYQLGISILSLAVSVINNNDIVNSARPYMEALSSSCQNLVFLTVEENNKAICVSMVNNSNKVKFYVKIGSEMPVHCAVGAQAIFAYKTDKEIDALLKNKTFTRYTEHTLVEAAPIKEKLAFIKQMGYGICDEEMELGVRAIAVPIKNRFGQISASLTVIGIKYNESKEDQLHIIEDLKRTASQISKTLGYIE